MILEVALLVFLYMGFFFLLALIRKDNSVADFAWGLGFVLVAFYTFFSSGIFLGAQILVTSLVFLWGLRLAAHIYVRNKGKGEDPRYREWRKNWGKTWVIQSFLKVFMFQGFLLVLISASVIVVNSYVGASLGILSILGTLVWIVGFFFETVGDYQLLKFVKNTKNKGKIMDGGLWEYTRHPNYFGEVSMWWGIFIIALGSPYWYYALISPLVITFLLLKVSGIPLAEKRMAKDKEFQKYMKRTSVFFPWFSKK